MALPGHDGLRAARSWRDPERSPYLIALPSHGYGEHIDRYRHVARFLTEQGAVVHAGARHDSVNETNKNEVLGNLMAFVGRMLDER